jgi:hypothetical protein
VSFLFRAWEIWELFLFSGVLYGASHQMQDMNVYGEATPEQAKELHEGGIATDLPPVLPDEVD